jgi:hypothetical protein
MKKTRTLLVKEMQDSYVRENFMRLQDIIRRLPLDGFRHLEITFDAAQTNKKVAHGLGAKPKDVIQTSLTGTGSVTWNYSSFDDTYLDVTSTGACVVRAYVGTHTEAK